VGPVLLGTSFTRWNTNLTLRCELDMMSQEAVVCYCKIQSFATTRTGGNNGMPQNGCCPGSGLNPGLSGFETGSVIVPAFRLCHRLRDIFRPVLVADWYLILFLWG
jgi:hypothetical protein